MVLWPTLYTNTIPLVNDGSVLCCWLDALKNEFHTGIIDTNYVYRYHIKESTATGPTVIVTLHRSTDVTEQHTENVVNFANLWKIRRLSASSGFAPWPPDQGLCPWTSLGAPPPDPCYRLMRLVGWLVGVVRRPPRLLTQFRSYCAFKVKTLLQILKI